MSSLLSNDGELSWMNCLLSWMDCAFCGDLISAGDANLLIALGLGVLARLRALVVLLLASLVENSECVVGLLVVGVDRP